MGISQICKTIDKLFSFSRSAAPKISEYLMICSLIKRPGLSTIVSTGNVTKVLARYGIPTGENPDGTPNLEVAKVMAVIDEVYRAIRKDMSLSVAALPGTISIFGSGANAAGPVIINGINITTGQLVGQAQ